MGQGNEAIEHEVIAPVRIELLERYPELPAREALLAEFGAAYAEATARAEEREHEPEAAQPAPALEAVAPPEIGEALGITAAFEEAAAAPVELDDEEAFFAELQREAEAHLAETANQEEAAFAALVAEAPAPFVALEADDEDAEERVEATIALPAFQLDDEDEAPVASDLPTEPAAEPESAVSAEPFLDAEEATRALPAFTFDDDEFAESEVPEHIGFTNVADGASTGAAREPVEASPVDEAGVESEPAELIEATEHAEPAELIEATDHAEPAELIEATDHAEATEHAEVDGGVPEAGEARTGKRNRKASRKKR